MKDYSLRGFLVELEALGELVRISEEVQGEEIFSILWKLFDKKGPAIIFEHVKDHEMPIVANVFGTMDRFAMACGFPRGKSVRVYREMFLNLLESNKSWPKPALVESGPCKEVILKDEKARFSVLPVFRWHPKDAGAYITFPSSITKDEKFGTNVGMYRMMIHDDKTSGIMCSIFQHQGIYLNRAIKKGANKIDCVIALSSHPSVSVASAATMDIGDDEFALVGAMRNQPLKVIKAETCDLEVPAEAEIVLEGEISTTERRIEAPFAEYGGYHEESMVLPVFKLNCITMRRDAMYLMGTADREGEILRQLSHQARFLQTARTRITGFTDCWLPESGHGYSAVVSIKKYYPGWGQQAIYQVLGLPFAGAMLNNIIIVDSDVDPANLEQVMWALSTRVDPHNDVVITKPMAVYPLNPGAAVKMGVYHSTGSSEFLVGSKMGIDATMKMSGTERPARGEVVPVEPPEDVMTEVDRKWSKLGLGHI
ncbi:UbiD family decarboxylase [Chloroflexota bacterium]